MVGGSAQPTILIVDDEWQSPIVTTVRRRLEDEGWRTTTVRAEERLLLGDAFEAAALYEIEEEQPDAVLLDVRFGEHPEDRFKGLGILRKILDRQPRLPVLMFTQYAQGPDRETAVTGALKWDARVDFIDKLASPEEVVLRLRRLMGTTPQLIPIGSRISLDGNAATVYVTRGEDTLAVGEIQGMRPRFPT